MLSALQVEAVSLRAEFSESVADEDFLRELRSKHDVYMTYDHKQKTRTAEAAAIRESGVTALWFGPFWGKKTFWQQAKWIVTRWELIDRFATSADPGTCAEVKENGKSRAFALR